MNHEDQPWWPELVKAAAENTSLLKLSKQFEVDPVSLVQAMKRAGVQRDMGKRSEPVRRVVRRLAAAPEPPPTRPRAKTAKPLPEEQAWWPSFLEVAGSRTLLELQREFKTDAIELVAALDRQGIDRSKLPKAASTSNARANKAAPPADDTFKVPRRRAKAAKSAPASAPSESDPLLSAVVTKLYEATEGTAASALAEGAPGDHLAVRNLLKELEQQGIVYRTGRARGTRWWLG